MLQMVTSHFVYQLSTLYLVSDGIQGNNFVQIHKLAPRDSLFKRAPYLYQHPYSPWTPILFLAGILCYVLLPRHRFSNATLCYGTGFSAVIGPDLVGLLVVTSFFTLGLQVGMSAAPGGIASIFSLFGLFMLRIAARYAGLGLHCSNGQITRFSPGIAEKLSSNQITSAELGSWKPSKWLTRFGFLISLLNWRAMGPTLLSASRNDPQLEICLKNGKVSGMKVLIDRQFTFP